MEETFGKIARLRIVHSASKEIRDIKQNKDDWCDYYEKDVGKVKGNIKIKGLTRERFRKTTHPTRTISANW